MAILQRMWVLANIAEDDKRERNQKEYQLDLLLRFLDGELFKRFDDLRSGRIPQLAGEGEVESRPAEPSFYDEVESLPQRRISKPPLKDEYIANRMKELAGNLAARGIEIQTDVERPKTEEKSWVVERKIIPKKIHG